MFRPKNAKERLQVRECFLCGYECYEIKEADCLIGTKEESGRYYLIIFDGTAGKPSVNCWYRTGEARQTSIDLHIKNRVKTLESKEKRKQKKNVAGKYVVDLSKPHFEVGEKYFMEYYNDDPWSHTAVIKVIKRTACFVTFLHCHGTREDEKTTRAKVTADKNGEYLSFGSFYYFRASSRCLTAEEEAEQRKLDEMKLAEQEKMRVAEERAEFEEIKRIIAENPVCDNDLYTVKIEWCEALIETADYMENRIISIPAAEKIFSMVDESRAKREHYGYDKWKFQILKKGEKEPVWIDRYDMGDGNGGFIAFMKRYKEGRDENFCNMIDTLESMVSGGYILSSVSVAPWIEEAISDRERFQREQLNRQLEMLEFLTDAQLSAAVLMIPNDDPQKADVARFFLQELSKRDEQKALDTLRAWKRGEGFPMI